MSQGIEQVGGCKRIVLREGKTMSTTAYVNAMYTDPQMVFQMQYQAVRRDEVVGVLLALFLGGFGIHHFYLGRTGLGILYIIFSWTGIPWILGFIECFFMPGRVRMYNAMQAVAIATALGIGVPGWTAYPGWVAPGYGGPVTVNVNAPGPGQAYGQAGAGPAAMQACTQCGHVSPAGSRFCSGCGTGLAG